MAATGPAETAGRNDDIADRISSFLEQTEPEFAPDAGADDERKLEGPDPAPQRGPEGEVDQDTKPEPEAEEAEEATETGKEGDQKTPAEGEAADDDAGIETLSQLAGVFEVEESDLLDTLSVTPSEGAESVPLRALVDRYNEGPQVVADPKAELEFTQRKTELETDYGQRAQDLQILTTAMLDLLEGDRSKLEELRHDPSAYMAQRERVDQQQALIQKAIGKFRADEAKHAEMNDQEHQAFLKVEADKVLKARPAWREEGPRREGMAQLHGHLKARGFTDEEIGSLADSRLILVAHEASEYARMVSKAKGTKDKKLLKLPKVNLKRGARDEGVQARERKSKKDKMWDRLEKSGDEQAAAALIAELELTDI